jgi:CxxC-x17-CxxC domain-containing protein
MGNFQGGGNRGGGFRGGNGGGGRPFRGGDRGEVTMHKAVCDECQKNCEVPFRPSGDKPVYCSDCFSGKKGDDRGPRKDFGGDRGPRRDFNDRPAPAPFAKPAPANDDMKNQFREINVKLDRLVTAIEKLTQTQAPKAEVKSAPVVKTVAKKAIAKKVVSKKKK